MPLSGLTEKIFFPFILSILVILCSLRHELLTHSRREKIYFQPRDTFDHRKVAVSVLLQVLDNVLVSPKPFGKSDAWEYSHYGTALTTMILTI
jgi:hypothetical protein